MEDLIYKSVHLVCLVYILYKVWGWKSKVDEICLLLYGSRKESGKDSLKGKNADAPISADESDVMGSTRFVYLDENAGKNVAPFMSQPLEMGTDYIGEDEEIPEEEVECKLSLDEMKILKEEQEELDEMSPETDSISQVITLSDLDNVGDVLFRLNHADKDEEKSRRAAIALYTIRDTDLFDIFSSQIENKGVIENLFGKYLDGEGIPLPFKGKTREYPQFNWRSLL